MLTSLEQILVPVDFSKRSVAAAEHAALIAGRFGSQLNIVYVVPRPPYEGSETEVFYGPSGDVISGKDLDDYYHFRLKHFVEDLPIERECKTYLLKGDPAQEIARFAYEGSVDLAVVPTHGYGVFRRFLLGSVTAKILHDVHCPVFTGAHVPELPTATPSPYERVLCAIDVSEYSEQVLSWARDFAVPWNAQLTVVHAAPHGELELEHHDSHVTKLYKELEEAAAAKVKKVMTKTGTIADLKVESGHAVHFVAETAKALSADLLIIGRGRAAQTSSRLPTHAYGIIRESPCPVISV